MGIFYDFLNCDLLLAVEWVAGEWFCAFCCRVHRGILKIHFFLQIPTGSRARLITFDG